MEQQAAHRNWSLYNLAQTSEKLLFLKMVSDAVDAMQIPYAYKGNGRPSLGIDDMIKCCCIKVFNQFSSRRCVPDLLLAKGLGYIHKVPHFNSIQGYMRSKEMVEYIHPLYKMLALPLFEFENNFAVDATGFGTFRKRWYESRLDLKQKMDFKKLHVVSGIRTNIITAAEASWGHDNDSPFFENLIKDTSFNFKVKKVYADAAYLSKKNCQLVADMGARPFIMPKSNTKEVMTLQYKGKISAWREMIALWKSNEELFREYYHKRSNVESTFSMMKRKFLPYIRSKDTQAQFNELIIKCCVHNASVLVNSVFELNASMEFNKKPVEMVHKI
jgi:transposase